MHPKLLGTFCVVALPDDRPLPAACPGPAHDTGTPHILSMLFGDRRHIICECPALQSVRNKFATRPCLLVVHAYARTRVAG